jgi:hypothetical protein
MMYWPGAFDPSRNFFASGFMSSADIDQYDPAARSAYEILRPDKEVS